MNLKQVPGIGTNTTHHLTAFCALLASAFLGLGTEPPSQEQILQKVSPLPDHPRLFWTPKDEAGVRKKINSDRQMKAVWEAVRITADEMLTEPVVVHRKDGRRLLGRSREALGRMMHLGFPREIGRAHV